MRAAPSSCLPCLLRHRLTSPRAVFADTPVCSTKISIKMGRASDKKKDTSHQHADVHDASSTSSDMDEDDDSDGDVSVQAEEDTPDLYRNSALGMCVGLPARPGLLRSPSLTCN